MHCLLAFGLNFKHCGKQSGNTAVHLMEAAHKGSFPASFSTLTNKNCNYVFKIITPTQEILTLK